ncbi:transposase InsO family protein [Halospina denitrificans]|uniref:Transposase InsO family protein n=1 Tax=Halospina denitrificans TaxID=332522 RepID=A0A4R7JF65_9GAMM|nr:transposase InsO family protein [Halospina denitrificans]
MKRYSFMLEHSRRFSVTRMAAVLGVSRSGYYTWQKTRFQPSQLELARERLDRRVKEAFGQSKQRDGARRIQATLAADGHPYDVKTIGASMRRQALVPKAARKFVVTTDSDHNLPVASNLLEQNFEATAPNQKWAGDITYLMSSEGWLYLAVIIDLYSRSVIGWSMNTRMTADLVCDALEMALWRRNFPKGVICHSDQGSQYCSRAYRDRLRTHQLRQSMSRKGNCWDNACVESFFHSMKVEAIHYEPMMNREPLRQHVFEYIEVDYNRRRRHSALGYVSPMDYELKTSA